MTLPHIPVIIIGGGQAGLSVSWYLCAEGVEHLVLERAGKFESWRHNRWDSFCLVTPNWQCRLPGWPYNLFAKLGGESRDEVEEQRSAVAALLGPACRGHDILFSTRVLKKTGMRLAGEG